MAAANARIAEAWEALTRRENLPRLPARRETDNTVISAIHIGKAEVQVYEGRRVVTAAHKRAVGSAMLSTSGFEGDEQADRRHHGGPDKAVCVYSADHYGFWREFLGMPIEFGAFGENLTVEGAREGDICIGDILQVGDSTAQVTQPRQPCGKLADRHSRPDLVEKIRDTGFSGFYLRVLTEGPVRAGDPFFVTTGDPAAVSVQFANRVMHRQLPDLESLRRLLSVPALSEAWREALQRRLP